MRRPTSCNSWRPQLGKLHRKFDESSLKSTTCDKLSISFAPPLVVTLEPSKWSALSNPTETTAANLLYRQSSTITKYRTTISARTGNEESEYISTSQDESTDAEPLVLQRPQVLHLDQSTDFDRLSNALQSSTIADQELDEVSLWLN